MRTLYEELTCFVLEKNTLTMANQPPVNQNHDEMRDTLAVCGIDVPLAHRVINTNGDGVDSLHSSRF
jgi:hypothetical protein